MSTVMAAPLFPLELQLLASVNGRPLPGAWFVLTIPMNVKNPYRLLFGPASSEGTFVINREDILGEIQKVRDLFLMDYVDPNISWTGALEIHLLNPSEIANALIAYDTYRDAGVYPPDLPEKLMELMNVLDNYEGEALTVNVNTQSDGQASVRTVTRRVE